MAKFKLSALEIMKKILALTRLPFVYPEDIEKLLYEAGLDIKYTDGKAITKASKQEIEAVIFFLHGLTECMRDLSVKIFPDLEVRERVIIAMQQALDRLIAQEEEMEAELEPEEEKEEEGEEEA